MQPRVVRAASSSSVIWAGAVVVPGMHERGDAVLLWLRDGSVVPIESLRTTQAPDDATGVHPWYARAGESVVRVHQQWLAQHGGPGR